MTPAETATGEVKIYEFQHPFTGDLVEFRSDMPLHERLRLISDFSSVTLDFERARLQGFFPDEMPSAPFKEESVGHPEETAQPEYQKSIRIALMDYLGYRSPKKKGTIEYEDIGHLNVAFVNRHDAIVNQVNHLPAVTRTKFIAQTEPTLMVMAQPDLDANRLEKYSLWQHINHLGYSFAMTNFRIAIQQPELYIQRVEKDMREFEAQYKLRYEKNVHFNLTPSESTKKVVDDALGAIELDTQLNEAFQLRRQALSLALEYAKYLEIYIKFHDIESPGLKDVFMRTRARVEDQHSVNFSEDEALIDTIDDYAQRELAPILRMHNLDSELLRVIVASLASENSPTLGGYLIKDKRKGLNKREGFEFIPTGQGFDHDQESGTKTNGTFLVNRFLPGGFKKKDKATPPPIGSFDERARLLAYAVATRMDKKDLARALRDLGIDPELVYISTEEVSVAPNIALREYKGEQGLTEIMPVSLVPGDVKRAVTLQNLLYTFYYFGSDRFTHELLIQDGIACGLFNSTLTEQMFLYRNDYEIARILNDIAPVLELLLTEREIYIHALVLSEDELSLLVGDNDVMNDVLITQVVDYPNPIMTKSGTLVEDDRKEIRPYLDILGQKRTEMPRSDEIHPQSLNARQQNVIQAVKGKWFMMIQVSESLKRKMLERISEGRLQDPGSLALKIWTESFDINQRKISIGLRKVFFSDSVRFEGSS